MTSSWLVPRPLQSLGFALLLGCNSEPAAPAVAPSSPVPMPSATASPTAQTTSAGSTRPYEAFWTWFRAEHERLRAAIQADSRNTLKGDLMNAELQKIHSALIFELPTAENGVQPIVLSADGDVNAFPHVKQLIAAAPNLKGWKFIAFRQPSPDPAGMVIKISGAELSTKTVMYRSEPDGDKIGLTIFIPDYTLEAKYLKMGAIILLDHVVGEYATETRIGFINLRATPKDLAELKPLFELQSELNLGGAP